MKYHPICISVVSMILFFAASTPADDWTAWRGPDGTGISREKDWNPAAITDSANIAWRVNVGSGFAAVSVKGPRVFTMGNIDSNDVVFCLDAATGKEIWRHSYPCLPGSHPGTRATPVIDGDRVYTVSREGHLFCLKESDGGIIWQKNFIADYQAQNLKWGISSSVLIDGDMLIVNAGESGMAFDKNTAKPLWKNSGGLGNYATPLLRTINGRKQVLIFSVDKLNSLDRASGKMIWSFPWVTRFNVNAADPVVSGNRVFVSSGYNKGCALLEIKGSKAKKLWQHTGMRNHFSSSILIDGYLYGIDGNAGRGSLKCLKWAGGDSVWQADIGFGNLMAADGKLIVINEKGTLYIAHADPKKYREIAQAHVLSYKCWTAPVLSNGRIYCRNHKGDMVCINVSK